MNKLSPIPEDLELWVEIASLCKEYVECDKYRLAVARQRRDLVMGEAEAFKKWPETKAQRDKERELQEIRRLLKSENELNKEPLC
jgi:hypothetical protein